MLICQSCKQKLKQVQQVVLSHKAKEITLNYNNFKKRGTNENYFTDKEVSELEKIGTLQECVVLVDAKYWGIN